MSLHNGSFVAVDGVGTHAHACTTQGNVLGDVGCQKLTRREGDGIAICGLLQRFLQGAAAIVGGDTALVAEGGQQAGLCKTHGGAKKHEQGNNKFLHKKKKLGEAVCSLSAHQVSPNTLQVEMHKRLTPNKWT